MAQIDLKTKTPAMHKQNIAKTPLVQVMQTFNAPVEKVFEAWVDENILRQWWAPIGFSVFHLESDFQVGGQYFMSMRRDGSETEIWSTGKYIDIIPNRFIVFEDSPSNKKGEVLDVTKVDGPYADRGPSYITVEIDQNGSGQSVLTLSQEGLPERMHSKTIEGWMSAFDKLKTIVEKH